MRLREDEGAQAFPFLTVILLGGAYRYFQLLITHEQAVCLCKFAQLQYNIAGIYNIDDEYAEEYPENKGEAQVFAEPQNRLGNVRVYQKIVSSAECRPYQRKFQTDNSAVVEKFRRIVPKRNLEAENEYFPGNKLEQGHQNSRNEENEENVRSKARKNDFLADKRQGIQRTQPEAVNREIGSGKEAGIYPSAAGEAPVKKLKQPAEKRAYEKEKYIQ